MNNVYFKHKDTIHWLEEMQWKFVLLTNYSFFDYVKYRFAPRIPIRWYSIVPVTLKSPLCSCTITRLSLFINRVIISHISHKQALLKKVREEGKKVLSLSEQALLRRHGYNIEVEEIRKAWMDEKDSLLAAVHSLKELLAETHKGRDPSKVGWYMLEAWDGGVLIKRVTYM